MQTENAKDNKIERLLDGFGVDFEKIDMDDDLNYIVSIKTDEILSDKDEIVFILFYSFEIKELVAICPLYDLPEEESPTNVLRVINTVNSKLSGGSILFDGKNVVYRRVEYLGRIELITKRILNNIFNDVIASFIFITEEMKVFEREV